MPRKYYPETNPLDESVWITLDNEAIILKVSVAIVVQGPEVVTQWLRDHGYAVQSAEDWHLSPSIPPEP
jgi:hypothetical protein